MNTAKGAPVICGWRVIVVGMRFIEMHDFVGTDCWSAVLEATRIMRAEHNMHEDVPIWIKEVRPIHRGGTIGEDTTCYYIPLDDMGRPLKEGTA